ncbi:MAG: DUF2330 domain-containing protein [Candidatus Binatia bacterium]
MRNDARVWQCGVLAGVLIFGMSSLDFPLSLVIITSTLLAGVLGEYTLSTIIPVGRGPRPLSATISAISVLLLFRSTAVWAYPAVTLLAVASKYCVRIRGRHWLNPTNFAILLGTQLLPGWLSSGQWGHLTLLPLVLGGLGILVLVRAGRLDSAGTFFVVHTTLEWVRVLYYGYPYPSDVVIHRLNNGALWLFMLYMLTDPQTTPRARWGRIFHASFVALLAFYLSEWWYWKDTFLWALLFVSPLVPLTDWLHTMSQNLTDHSQPLAQHYSAKEVSHMYKQLGRISLIFLNLLLLSPNLGHCFCGFYVARADAKLYNSSSQVVVVRDEDKTVLTMVNNFKGNLKEFAMVIPVPTVLEKELVRVIDPQVITHLDAYSAPRLVEYFDPDPCERRELEMKDALSMRQSTVPTAAKSQRPDEALGVRVEAAYTVGEYDIVILSATESQGLETWLKQNQYHIPTGASQALAPYIRSDMKFFVAKVNLKEQARSGFTSLRPLQFAFASPRFTLPIRLGMINADGPQDLLVYFLTKQYRVEVTNYRNPKLPSNQEVPPYIKQEFPKFYTDLFQTAMAKENHRAVFTEYAWNMGWCDPCAAEPLSRQELERLGVWWLEGAQAQPSQSFWPQPTGDPMHVYVTRLHVRYEAATFPEDLIFKITQDSSNFQGRYIIRHPWTGQVSCSAGREYLKQLAQRQETEARTLASLTGWDLQQISEQVPKIATVAEPEWTDRIKALFTK